MNVFFKWGCIFVFVFIIQTAKAQYILKGKVVNADTSSGIENVSVYIPELNIGVYTDIKGNYMLEHLKKGKFLLQFVRLGYENAFYTFEIIDSVSYFEVAMSPSHIEMDEVKIVGNHPSSPKETSFNITQLSLKDIRANGSLSISDAVSKLPGISQLTTGAGISKPVIRGLYGNRIQVNVMGLRFDNQQWQDEHGMGLNDMGIDRVEIVKGPATLLYGADAVGGVLNVIEEKPAPVGTKKEELNLKLQSNVYGLGLDYGIKKSTEKKWWRVRVGGESNGDYADGNNKRILNSRFATYNVKASLGYNKKNWINKNNIYASLSQFGFVFDSLSRKTLDGRLSRTFDGPHHTVFFEMISTENIFYRRISKIKFNLGFISNIRQEQEGGNRISLNMMLTTVPLLLQHSIPVGRNAEWSNGINGLFQSNKNFGSRTIIPDATTLEGGIFSYYKHRSKVASFEAGVRYDRRQIQTFLTDNALNGPGSGMLPFNKGYNVLNGSFGTSVFITERINLKANASTGYRSGNLAELSSNGLHEGTSRWEIGDPNLKAEQNLNTEFSANYEGKQFSLKASAYRNRFANYIYLAPTGLEYVGFNIYKFEQTNATLMGGEASLDWSPSFISWLDASANYTYIQAKKDDGSYLPFIPANKINGEIKTTLRKLRKIKDLYFKVGGNYVFAQNNPAEFETRTGEYFLLNAGLGGNFKVSNHQMTVSVMCNNMLNKDYYDHLSRFKYYGIYNIGRNIVANINYSF